MRTKLLQLPRESLLTRRVILIVAISISWAIVDTHQAHACSCTTISPSEAFDSADLVFAGQVIDAQTFYHPVPKKSRDAFGQDYYAQVVYAFLVSAAWKGDPSEVAYIVSMQNPTSCTGRGFSIGERYLVYVESDISVGACSRIVRLDSAQEDLRALGAGQPPESGTVAPRPFSMDNGCSWEARILAIVGIRHDRDLRGCFEAFARASTTSSTAEPTATAAPSPTPTPDPPLPQRLCPPRPPRNRRPQLCCLQRRSQPQPRKRHHQFQAHSPLKPAMKQALRNGSSPPSRALRVSSWACSPPRSRCGAVAAALRLWPPRSRLWLHAWCRGRFETCPYRHM